LSSDGLCARSILEETYRTHVPKFFNLLEAEGQIPEVERLVRTLQDLKRSYEEADTGLSEINQRVALAGGMIPPRDRIAMLRNQKEANTRGLKSGVERIQEIGCQLKDLETGLVDFPTLYKEQEVYLCWKLGEAGIGFWHHVEDGVRGRRQIDGEFLKNHRGGEC
jgi:hypothetical protein